MHVACSVWSGARSFAIFYFKPSDSLVMSRAPCHLKHSTAMLPLSARCPVQQAINSSTLHSASLRGGAHRLTPCLCPQTLQLGHVRFFTRTTSLLCFHQLPIAHCSRYQTAAHRIWHHAAAAHTASHFPSLFIPHDSHVATLYTSSHVQPAIMLCVMLPSTAHSHCSRY